MLFRFNIANTLKRDKNQLKNQWKCLKLNSKKELSQYRRDCVKTGGGPKPPSPSKDIFEVAEMIPQEFEVDFNKFDCDGDKVQFLHQINKYIILHVSANSEGSARTEIFQILQ